MGHQQRAFIAAVQQHEQACHPAIADLKTGISKLAAIEQQIVGAKDQTTRDKLKKDRLPHFGTLIKARGQLKPQIEAYEKSVSALDTFVKEKSKRWFGKSTLPQAQTFLAQSKTQVQDFKDLIDTSLHVKT